MTALGDLPLDTVVVADDDTRLSDARAPTAHTHNDKADATHGHAQADVTGLVAALTGKAAAVHAHPTYAREVGELTMWPAALASIPAGWLLCDGSVKQMADHPSLGALLGNKYGGNGTTTFAVPNFLDAFPRGVATAATEPGTAGGAATHSHAAHTDHVVTQPNAHTVTQPSNHTVTQPSNHVVTQPSNHTVTQPAAHSNHVVTQPANHTVTQPAAHSNHAAFGTHAHELPYQIPSTTTTRQIAAATFGTGTSRAATAVSANGTANTTSAAVALSQAVSAGTPDAHSAHSGTAVDAHSGTAVDAHSAHSGTAVDAHAGTAVDAHSGTAVSAHAGTAVSAHAGTAVDSHSAHAAGSSLPPFVGVAFLIHT